MRINTKIILLAAVLVLAGCITTQQAAGGVGVIISSFIPDISSVESNTPVTFTLVVKNTGEQIANGVRAVLIGLSDEWTNENGIEFSSANAKRNIATQLLQADPSRNFQGEEATTEWTFTRQTPKSVDITYDVSARVFYNYATVSESLLRVVSSDYYRTIQTQGQQQQTFGIVSSKATSGPLTINVKAITSIIPKGSTNIPVQFEIINNGAGRVYNGDVANDPDAKTLDKVDIVIPAKMKCGDVGPFTEPTKLPEGQRLTNGKSKVLSCYIIETVENVVEIPITLTVSYNYFVDSTTSVTVLKSGLAPPADKTAPTITHTPVGLSTIGSDIPIVANITDDTGITSVAVWVKNNIKDWESIKASKVGATTGYTATIPGSYAVDNTTTIQYYIQAEDFSDNIAYSPVAGRTSPYSITIS